MAETEPHPRRSGRVVLVIDNGDGTKTMRAWPIPGVLAVAELLRSKYVSEHETNAPVSEWYQEAWELINAYLTAEAEAAKKENS